MQYVAGALSHALCVKQKAREIFPTPFGVSSKFAEKNVYERKFATYLLGLSKKIFYVKYHLYSKSAVLFR